eukprot:5939073-Ditylum_brightwellii.AAC.1
MQGNVSLKFILRLLLQPQRHTQGVKPNTSRAKADKEKEVELNAFDKFFSLNVESSDEEDKPNKHTPVNEDNDDSSVSRLLNDD